MGTGRVTRGSHRCQTDRVAHPSAASALTFFGERIGLLWCGRRSLGRLLCGYRLFRLIATQIGRRRLYLGVILG